LSKTDAIRLAKPRGRSQRLALTIVTNANPVTIRAACLPAEIAAVRKLFLEYVDSLGVDLAFQDVESELADLPGKYALPRGVILLAWGEAGQAVGCVALRPLADPGSCEIKRLYVRAGARGQDTGRRLAQAIVERARAIGYARVKLDTLDGMLSAQRLYISLGFRPTEPYYDNPLLGTRYMVLELQVQPSP
jgi:putative acetyltransferase